MTVQDLIRGSLISIGVIGAGAPIESAEADDALTMTQDLIDSLNADRLCIGTQARTTYTWPVSQSQRTIGATGQLVGPRPLWVDAWAVIPSGETYELERKAPMSRDEYARIHDKSVTADVFRELRYEPTPDTGTITVWPVPTTAPTLVLYVPVALTALSALTTTLSFAPGYRELLRYALAERLAPAYKQPWTPGLAKLLRGAYLRVERNNARVEKRQNDSALVGRGYFDIDLGRRR